MLPELDALENRIAEVVSLCQALRAENEGLRQRLDAADAVRDQLAERMRVACTRIEQLALQLPAGKP